MAKTFKYELRLIGSDKVTHIKTLSEDVSDPWAEDINVGKMASHGYVKGNYEVIKTDLTAQKEQQANEQASRKQVLARVHQANNLDELKQVVIALIKELNL